MKTLIAASAMVLLAGAAFAGEGQGNPFPFNTTIATINTAPVVSPPGAAGEVQSLNSLPRGFEDGTVTGQLGYAVAPSPTRTAQPVVPGASTHG